MPVQHKSTHKNAVRSRQMIKKAFAEMLNEKDISKITVTDIVEKAGISRGTFYAHYMDVYDLYNAIQSNMMEAVQETINEIGAKQLLLDPTEVLAQAFRFLDEKKFYYKLFITSSRSDALVKRIIAYIGDSLSTMIDSSFTDEERREINLFLGYSLGAMENIVKAWLDEKLNIKADECAALIAKTYLRSKPEALAKLEAAAE